VLILLIHLQPSVIINNLKVVLVDVDPLNGNIDVNKIEALITSKTVAIAPVDYAGILRIWIKSWNCKEV